VRRCKLCDSDISHRAPQAKYCDDADCKRERALAAGRASWVQTGEKQRARRRSQHAEKKAQQPPRRIFCHYCKKEILHKAGRAKWCNSSCREKARHAANPDRARLKVAKWRVDNPERSREVLNAWRAANLERYLHHSRQAQHRRRAQKESSPRNGISLKAWLRLVNRFQGRCAYCGQPPRPGERLEQDHVVPLSRRGAHSEGNILPACDACNVRKNDRFLVEWRFGKRTARRRKRIQWALPQEYDQNASSLNLVSTTPLTG
jgi:hypothetical protein